MRFLLARRACVGMTSGGEEPHTAETECGITSPLCKRAVKRNYPSLPKGNHPPRIEPPEHPCTHAPTLSFRPQRSVAEESAFPSSTENPSCKAQAQTDEIPPRPKGLRRNDKQRRGCEDTRMIQPLNTNKSSPAPAPGGSPILLAELLAETSPQITSG
jgi:hypothetical protein